MLKHTGGRLLVWGRDELVRLSNVASQRPAMIDGLVVVALSIVGLVVARHLLQDGFPPGVDTPTFLHMSWFTRETLLGDGGLIDPYWYDGFPMFTTYPPLSYTVVGALAALPGFGLIFTYKLVLIAAYIGTGVATYALAREIGNTRPWCALAAMLTMLAHPVLVSVGLWGWFSSIVALPLALAALAMLERAYHGGRARFAVAGGVALGLAVLAHHMTAFALVLGLPAWVLLYHLRHPGERRRLYRMVLLFSGAVAVTTVWWIIPWALNLLEVGFQREIPGNWSFPLDRYLRAITQGDLIGMYAYPTYLGIGLIVMAIGGMVQAVMVPSRATPYVILLVLLVAF
ncbi:MAG: 6-pyruvoyl-tetrahydropterin synthase-related protein, partial [Dehalococcoidia bacterium]